MTLVSTLIPSSLERLPFLRQALVYAIRQDWEPHEVVVVGDKGLSKSLGKHPRVRVLETDERTAGAKLNIAAEASRGAVLVRQDDDDWYGPGRVRSQVAPILRGDLDASCLRLNVVLDLHAWEFWAAITVGIKYPYGGNLAVSRDWWRRTPYRAARGEDTQIILDLLGRGARWRQAANWGHAIYVRHGKNSCGLGGFKGLGWMCLPGPPPFIPEVDLRFYRAGRSS